MIRRRLLLLVVALLPLPAAAAGPAARAARPAAERAADPFEAADRLMWRAARDERFESAVLLVGRAGQPEPLLHRAYGNARRDTLFDLASLTKPLATTSALMQLVGRGRLDLRQPLGDVLPELRGAPAGEATFEQLLSHTSGLPRHHELFDVLAGNSPAAARRALLHRARSWSRERVGSERYSDLNFLLLGQAVERIDQKRLDRVARDRVFAPLGLRNTHFAPVAARPEALSRYAPTERTADRGRIRGEVHDQKAFLLGGVAGHAGLFSTAGDVFRIAQSLLDAYHGRPSPFSSRVVRQFFDARPGAGRALGWQRGTDTSAGGTLFHTERGLGHTGFTGTSLWLDLERELVVVLLSNRVFGGRDPDTLAHFRPRLHDAVAEGLDRAIAPFSGR